MTRIPPAPTVASTATTMLVTPVTPAVQVRWCLQKIARRYCVAAAFVAALTSMASERAFAQPTASPSGVTRKPVRTRSWIALGLGVGGSGHAGGIGALGEYVFQHHRQVFMLRAAGGFEIDLAGDGADTGVGDVGVLYGRAINGEVGHVLFAGGLGALYGGCGYRRGKDCKTIPSIPLAVEAAFHFGPVVGLGANVFANINQRELMGGAIVSLQLGWFGLSRSQ